MYISCRVKFDSCIGINTLFNDITNKICADFSIVLKKENIMDYRQELGTRIVESLSLISFQTSLFFIMIVAFMSLFHNQKIAFRYLKYMSSSAILLIFAGSNILYYEATLHSTYNDKVFNINLELEKEKISNNKLNNELINIYIEKKENDKEALNIIEKLSYLVKLIKAILVITIGFLWIHYLIEMSRNYSNILDKIAFVTVYMSIYLLFKYENPLYILPFLMVSLGYIFKRYFWRIY